MIDDDLAVSHPIADGWGTLPKRSCPALAAQKSVPQAHVAFYFGAMHVLQLLGQVVAHRLAEAAALALSILDAEIDGIIEVHGVTTQ